MTSTMPASSESWIVEACASGVRASRDGRQERGLSPEGALVQAEFIVRTIAQLLQCANPIEGSRLMANRLQQFLGCRQVAIGLCAGRRQRCRIHGLSGVVRFDSHSGFVGALQDAIEETLLRESETAWPPKDEAGKPGSLAHQKLVSILGAECVASVPLRDSGQQIVGVVLFVDEPAEGAFELLRRHGSALSASLSVLDRDRGNVLSRTARRLIKSCATWRGRVALLAVLCGALLLAAPWPYRISGQCQVQPMVRRFIVAPYDGTLEKTLVAPGDVVRKGDMLARMDEREIRWELAGLKADYSRADKQRDAAMAVHRTSAAQLAALEMDRLRVQMELLEHRASNLAIRSPVDGVVVAGDLEKAEGAPLTVGQTLYEVAPLEKMVIEVDIPEEEIARVRAGMRVDVQLDAFPGETFSADIQRIHPQAELRDHQSVFVGELEMDNRQGRLRPGMNGQARIASGHRSLGWVLFHKPWTSLRRAIAW